MNHETIFTNIYKNKNWATKDTMDLEFNSGDGSSIINNQKYISFLQNFIRTRNIKSVVDVGCGDWRCGEEIYKDLTVTYSGYDIYDAMIESHSNRYINPLWSFKTLNCARDFDKTVEGELLIIKDVLQHWTDDEIVKALDYFTTSKKYKYILITNCSYVTHASIQNAGDFRTLPINYGILQKYKLKEVLQYYSKTTSLIELDKE